MLDIAAQHPALWPWLDDLAKVRRAVATLILLGFMSLAAVADHPLAESGGNPPDQGGPLILGVSLLGGSDCLTACIPSSPTME
jgi:hypothetical protein